MKKLLILPLALFLLVQSGLAQTPKWVEKAKRAVFSVITYDKNDKMLNTGNGFFVSEDGLALSDYSLFKGAERAVIVTAEGKQMPVSLILGADDMYDVIKFRVAITEKKVPSLVVATTEYADERQDGELPGDECGRPGVRYFTEVLRCGYGNDLLCGRGSFCNVAED